MLDDLRKDGAKVIAFDVQFTEPTDPGDDNALIDAVARAKNVVLATTEVNANGGTDVLGGGGILRQIGARAGNALLPTDLGGTFAACRTTSTALGFASNRPSDAIGQPIKPSALGRLDGLDRLRRAARDHAHDLVLRRPGRQVRRRAVPEQDRRHRAVGAVAAGRPSDVGLERRS